MNSAELAKKIEDKQNTAAASIPPVNETGAAAQTAATEKIIPPVDEKKPDLTQAGQPPVSTPAAENTNIAPEITEASMLKYLSDKHGIKAENVGMITEKFNYTPVEHQYASETAAAIDKYVKETGRDAKEFFELTREYDTLDKTQRIIDFQKSQYPGLTDEMISATLKLNLPPLDPENNEPEDIAARANEILLRDAELIRLDTRAKEVFETRKQQYASPTDARNQEDAGKQTWAEGIAEAAKDFNLGVEGYEYKSTPEDLTARYSTLESMLNQFADKDGNIDYKRYMQVMEVGLNASNITNARNNAGNAEGQQQVLNEMSNTSDGTKGKPATAPVVKDQETIDTIRSVINMRR